MIIGITGTVGAGKGAAVTYLVREKGFVHYSVRSELIKFLNKEEVLVDRSLLRTKANQLRKENGADYLVRLIHGRVIEENVQNVVIESIRTLSEAKYLQLHGGIIIAVDADRQKRYERIKGRRSGTDLIDFPTFVEQEEREWYGAEGEHDMNLMKVFEIADYKIYNNDTLVELHEKMRLILNKIFPTSA